MKKMTIEMKATTRARARLTLATVVLANVSLLTATMFFAPAAEGQSGTRGSRGTQGSGTQGSGMRDNGAHHEKLWTWLIRSKYWTWNGPDGKTPEFYEGQGPHGALLKTYISPVTARNLEKPPHGSVIVKENYNPEKKLMAITIMQRSTGYDPEHADWYYAKYQPDGKIAKTPPEKNSMPIAGRFNSCIDCHGGAGGDDYLFLND